MAKALLKTILFFGISQLAAVDAEAPHVAWVAGPFGDCVDTGDDCKGYVRMRDVTCKDVFTGKSDDGCTGTKPLAHHSCSCDTDCVDKAPGFTCPADDTDAGVSTEDEDDFIEVTPHCYKRETDDEQSSAKCDEDKATDITCMTYTGAGRCRSGFPFYRMHSDLMSPAMCFSFCVSKGLDIFALVDGGECRCGASHVNSNFWERAAPRAHLEFHTKSLQAAKGNADCEVRVWRYSGHYESGGVPNGLTDILTQDSVYAGSIVAGKQIDAGAVEDGDHPPAIKANSSEEGGLALAGEDADAAAPKWDRACWPGNCGPGSGPWKLRVAAPPGGGADKWMEYVKIPFVWDNSGPGGTVDDGRKEAFRVAVKAWKDSTCINLVEDPTATQSFIKVGIYDAGSCYLSGMGQPWNNGFSKINLGWCNSMSHKGNMIHEIGHALGMNHEQKRQDAAQDYEGKKAHLIMKWENIPQQWKPQYTPSADSYIGSANDGSKDPHTGYASYDFESIMHYPGGNRYDTVPASAERLVGNRKHLTTGDIASILDQYQCIPTAGYVKTTTTTTTTTADPYVKFCDFEGGTLCNFLRQDKTDDIDWTLTSAGTPSGGTGPSKANNGAWYAFIEASAPVANGATAKFVSQPVDLGTGAQVGMSYNAYPECGELKVEISTSDGNTKLLSSMKVNQGDKWIDWKSTVGDLDSYVGSPITFTISASKSSTATNTWRGDLAIDDFVLNLGAPTGGGAPPATTLAPVTTPAPVATTLAPVTTPAPAPTSAPPVATTMPPATTMQPPTNPTGPIDVPAEVKKLQAQLLAGMQQGETALRTLESSFDQKIKSLDTVVDQILQKLR